VVGGDADGRCSNDGGWPLPGEVDVAMYVFDWREGKPCPAHPGRACFLKWVPVVEQGELFPLDTIGQSLDIDVIDRHGSL